MDKSTTQNRMGVNESTKKKSVVRSTTSASAVTAQRSTRGNGTAKEPLFSETFSADAVRKVRTSGQNLSQQRYFTQAGSDPLAQVRYVKSSSKIKDLEGKSVFEMKDVEVPADWSQLAVDILVSKYFRKAGVPDTGHEVSVQQVVRRLARTIRTAGEQMGYFEGEAAEAFEAELTFMLVTQRGAFNSPVWFNLGLWHEYGIEGSGGNYYWDPQAMRIKETTNAYQSPQCSACFIQSVDDDLMGMFDLLKNEARLFKYGSGTGTNFSNIRGRQEKLSGGGTSSGLMSFLSVFDRGAGATKSGGTTRRAAKMVCLDLDHPEIMDFVTWKQREEKKVAALIAAGYSSDFNGDAYQTVAGQNSNNSVRVTDEFMHAVESDADWSTRARTTGEVIDTFKARELWGKVAEAAWACADPGVQYDTTINEWHTCADTARIYASNPCSEYMFLNDTACNLSSLNLVKFLKQDGSFDIEGFRHACRTFIIAQEILVDLSSYPTSRIAQNSHDYRPLGLGYANLGTLLMVKGIPYDSDQGRAWAAAITAIMCGHAYAVSAEEAALLGAFPGFAKNRNSMLKVIKKHREAAMKLQSGFCPEELLQAARQDWNRAVELGEKHGYRNAQVTVLAPTGTIGLLMDCDTTGVEPDFALVKFKKLAGGGYFKIVNNSVPNALRELGYSASEIEEILRYVLGTVSFDSECPVNRSWLLSQGLLESEITKIEKALPGTFELSSAFSKWSLGEETLKRLGVTPEEWNQPQFNFLRWAGLNEEQIAQSHEKICGTMTVEGAPHLKLEHLAVFDCANKCGSKGERFIAPMGHVRMMAAVQPFLSGAISKTVNLPHETTVQEIEEIYTQGWKLGLKAVALYRDGCKLSQPLSTKSSDSSSKKTNAATPTESKPLKQTEPEVVKSLPQEKNFALSFNPVRRKLPNKRRGFTQESSVAGHKVYIRTGEYENGEIGELFIDMHKEGAAYRSMMNCFAISVSLGLQYGVPLKEFVDKFTFTRFEPSGMVDGHPNIKLATSIVDYIFRVLGMEYLGRTDFVQVKPVDLTAEKGASEAVYPKEPAKESPPSVRAQMHAMLQPMNSHPTLAGAGGLSSGGTGVSGSVATTQHGVVLHAASVSLASASDQHLSGHLAEMMGDAPPCDSCGHTTVRNGACYKCLNCGNSMGCS